MSASQTLRERRCVQCGTLNASELGRCAQCGGPLLLECQRCGHTNHLGDAECLNCAGPLPAPGPTSGERRQLTVLFADLEGSSKLAESMDPEELHEIIAEYHATAARVIEEWGGYVAQYLGDGVLAYFGFPVAREDSASRATSAGLALQEAIERLNAGSRVLRARVGIHTGPVVIGELGSGDRREKLAVGETVNLAARVQSAARPGSVVVTTATRDAVESLYELRPLGLHSFRGVSSPIALHEVVSKRPFFDRIGAADRDSLSPFVGRSAELRLLNDAWEAVSQGRGQTLLLLGEAGIGKSRHALEFRRSVAGKPHELILGSCSPYHRDTAFHPIVTALSNWLGLDACATLDERRESLKRSLPEPSDANVIPLLAALLSIPPEQSSPLPPFGPQKMRERTLDAVREWILARAREKPLLLVVEDLHWVDPTSLELLNILSKQTSSRLLLLGTSRPVEGVTWDAEYVHALTLAPLASADIEAILGHLAAKYGLPASVARQIVERSEGVPLFAEELCKSVAATGAFAPSDGDRPAPGRDFPVPSTLQESVTARLDQLGSQKIVAQLASVLGREFRADVLRDVHRSAAGDDSLEVTAALSAMTRLALVSKQDETVYVFRHSLIQESTYRSLGRGARSHFHQHVARVLSTRYPDSLGNEPEILARHCSRADLSREAAHHYGTAGVRSLMRSAYVESAAQFTRALECLQSLQETSERDRHEVDLRAGLGFSLLVTKGFGAGEVEAVYRRGLQLAERMQDVPLRILYGIWAFHMLRGDTAETARLVPAYERICATSQSPLELLVANAALGSRAFYRGRYAEAIATLARATQLCDRNNPGAQSAMLLNQYNFEGLLYAPMFLAYCHLFAGRVQNCRSGIQNALELAEKSNHPYLICSGLGCAAPMLHDMGDVDGTAEIGERLMRLAVEHGFPHWIASALCLNGWALAKRDPNGPGAEMLKQGIELIKMIGSFLTYPYFLSYLIEVHLLAGRPEEALPYAEEALRIGEDGLNIVFLPEIRRLHGAVLAAMGDSASAENEFRVTIATTHAQGAHLLSLRATVDLAELLERQGRVAEARQALSTAYAALPDKIDLPEVRRAEEWLARHENP